MLSTYMDLLEAPMDATRYHSCRVAAQHGTTSKSLSAPVRNVFVILVLLASRAESLRPTDDDSYLADVKLAANETDDGTPFMYIRHGESSGNAWYRLDYWDGVLTPKGETQAIERIEYMSKQKTDMLKFLTEEVEEVWVSPLRRAMATSLLVVARAWNMRKEEWGSLSDHPFPKFRIHPDLREKRCSKSEDPGASLKVGGFTVLDTKPAGEYLRERIAGNFAEMLLEDAHGLDDAIDQLEESYLYYENVTEHWTTNLPDTTPTLFRNIRNFKKDLAQSKKKVLLVAHGSLARFMFTGGLPAESPEDLVGNLAFTSRKVLCPNNAGVIMGKWLLKNTVVLPRGSTRRVPRMVGMTDLEEEEQWKIENEIPYFKDIIADEVLPGDPDNFRNLKGIHLAFLDDQKYVHREVEGVLPPEAEYYRFSITKKRLGWWSLGKEHKRELSIAIGRATSMKMVGTVSWVDPDKFGKPQGMADMQDVTFDQISTGLVSSSRKKKHLEQYVGKLLMQFNGRQYIVDFDECEKQGEFLAMFARLRGKLLADV